MGWSARHKWVSRSLARDEWIARTSDEQIVSNVTACKLALTTRAHDFLTANDGPNFLRAMSARSWYISRPGYVPPLHFRRAARDLGLERCRIVKARIVYSLLDRYAALVFSCHPSSSTRRTRTACRQRERIHPVMKRLHRNRGGGAQRYDGAEPDLALRVRRNNHNGPPLDHLRRLKTGVEIAHPQRAYVGLVLQSHRAMLFHTKAPGRAVSGRRIAQPVVAEQRLATGLGAPVLALDIVSGVAFSRPINAFSSVERGPSIDPVREVQARVLRVRLAPVATP